MLELFSFLWVSMKAIMRATVLSVEASSTTTTSLRNCSIQCCSELTAPYV